LTDRPPEGAPARIKVLHLIKGLNLGGAEHLLVLAARYRDRDRFTYEVAYLLPDDVALEGALLAEDVPVTCLSGSPWWDPRWILRLRRHLVRNPIDVLHAHSPLVATGARLVVLTIPTARRPKLVVTLHNMWRSHRLPIRIIDRCTYRVDDARLTVSEAVRRSLPRRASQQAITLIHGIDVELIAASADRTGARRELGVGDDEILVGTVANLRPTKGYPDLLAAAQRVTEARDGIRFVAVGQGPQLDELTALHEASRLGDRFRFLGYRSDVPRVASGFDIFCMSSRHEGLPVAVMEALVLGIPVVSTDVGGIGEIVTDGREGLLVPVANPELLARALLDLAEDPERREACAAAAAKRGSQLDAASATATEEAHYLRVLRP
jgi:glycosyltransferase involved in cell wall biosynthesis